MKTDFPYCLYFGGESQCPENLWGHRMESCLWKGERAASNLGIKDGARFLEWVVGFVCRAGLGNLTLSIARYVARFPFCGELSKIRIAEIFKLDKIMEFNRPRGWTVFENLWEVHSKFGGLALYRDGRVYELQGACRPETSLVYVLLGQCRALAEEVRLLIVSNWKSICGIPSRIGRRHFIAERCEYMKFLTRRFKLYLRQCASDGQKIICWSCKILKLALQYGFRMEGFRWVSLDFFVEKWSRFMDDFMMDRTRKKLYRFLGSEFAQDLRLLGFGMSGIGIASIDLERNKDYNRLGWKIYGIWKSLAYEFGNAVDRLDPQKFKAALARFGELGSKGFYKLKAI